MIRKLKLTPNQRGEALFLLDKGYSVDKAARTLQEIRHPKRTLEEVYRAYFPTSGPYSIHNFEGKPFEEIAKKFFAIKADRRTRIRRLRQLIANPVVENLRRERQLAAVTSPEYAEGVKLLWKNPQYRKRVTRGVTRYSRSKEGREAQSQIMRDLWAKPSYRRKVVKKLVLRYRDKAVVAKVRKSLLRFWKEKKEREAQTRITPIEQPATGKVERAGGITTQLRQMVPVHVPDMETTVDLWRALHGGLSELSPLQRFIAASALGIEMKHKLETVKRASGLTKAQRKAELEAAYSYLSKKAALKKLLGE